MALTMRSFFTLALAVFLSVADARAGLFDILRPGKTTNAEAALPASLSQDQIVLGLKQALEKGVQSAVGQLGREGGFLQNPAVRIPMPAKLQGVEKTLRAVKQDQLADEFVTTMNRAAEQAVPEAAAVFGNAIQRMSIADAKAILTGTNNAATQYFRRTTSTNLYAKFLPIVQQATQQTGVTSAYKRLTQTAGSSGSLASLGRSLMGAESLDVDAYVTNKALDGLFTMVATEEKRIRENPAARTTQLLQQVFGAVGSK